MNKCVIIGRFTKEPELKFIPGSGTAVCTGTIAVDRKVANKNGQREADFIPVQIWGKQAESTAKYSGKGKLIGISGRIQARSYDAKDGTKRHVTEVVAEEVQFLEWANSAEQNGQTPPPATGAKETYYENEMMPVDDGDIPF